MVWWFLFAIGMAGIISMFIIFLCLLYLYFYEFEFEFLSGGCALSAKDNDGSKS